MRGCRGEVHGTAVRSHETHGRDGAGRGGARRDGDGTASAVVRGIEAFGTLSTFLNPSDDGADRRPRWRWSESAVRRQNRVVRRDTRTASSLERGQPLTDFEKMRAAKGLGSEGVGAGGQWLSASTRHVVLYVGAIVDDDLDQTQLDSLTLDVDPEDEFTWTDEALVKVYSKFEELVAGYAGSPLNDYVLRLIGSDLEHYIRQLLLAGELKYNLNHRALNYSMGRPRLEGLGDDLDERK